MDIQTLEQLAGWGGVPVVIGLVEGAKKVCPDMDKRWLPLVALGMALLWQMVMYIFSLVELETAGPMVIITALAAVGLFSGGRATLGK